MFGAMTLGLKEPPSHYFKRQCWIAADPDERAVLGLLDVIGADRILWASDFPHPDHDDRYMHHLAGLIEPLSEERRQRILWKNAADRYGLA
jgi:predicted TIM-barrel fold metal-dependent hydrolase